MKWISVEEKLPEVNKEVLAYDTQRIYICHREEFNGQYNEHWHICEDKCCYANACTGAITHWMELPEPPFVFAN